MGKHRTGDRLKKRSGTCPSVSAYGNPGAGTGHSHTLTADGLRPALHFTEQLGGSRTAPVMPSSAQNDTFSTLKKSGETIPPHLPRASAHAQARDTEHSALAAQVCGEHGSPLFREAFLGNFLNATLDETSLNFPGIPPSRPPAVESSKSSRLHERQMYPLLTCSAA